MIAVLTNEEQALGLQQPAGIGQRPRPMGELHSAHSYILTADLNIHTIILLRYLSACRKEQLASRMNTMPLKMLNLFMFTFAKGRMQCNIAH